MIRVAQNNFSPQLLSPLDQFMLFTAVLFAEWVFMFLRSAL
jgi:hypothetical protein